MYLEFIPRHHQPVIDYFIEWVRAMEYTQVLKYPGTQRYTLETDIRRLAQTVYPSRLKSHPLKLSVSSQIFSEVLLVQCKHVRSK